MSAPNSLNIKNILNQSILVLNQFNWLIDTYVLDFYIDDHWNRLPSSWKLTLEKLEPEMLIDLYRLKSDTDKIVWPLSLISLRSLIRTLSISRNRQNVDQKQSPLPEPLYHFHPKLRNLFKKRVKSKKLHEIEHMAMVCAKTAVDCKVTYILDVGAGLGHLSRVLGYGYGLNVTCLEQQKKLTEQAQLFDDKLHQMATKYFEVEHIKRIRRPVHLSVKLTKCTDIDELLDQIYKSFGVPNDERENFSFGIVGLHPCGDLAAMLLNIFLRCKQAKFINIVGCCYMKMTESSFPLSDFIKNHKQCHFSYEAKEIACHAQEVYVQGLAELNYNHLKVHSYRAAVEKIICRHWPSLKHSGLKNVKHSSELTFLDYCLKATPHLNVEIPICDILSADIENDLKCWKKLVIFYTLRLLFASLVESVILFDRMLYALENNCSVKLDAIFDPHISPRNHVMTVTRNY